ncbi:hypothetical protein RRG12_30740 [Nostoc sp. CALU 546]
MSKLHTLALQGRLMAIEQQLKTLEKTDDQRLNEQVFRCDFRHF